MPKMSPPHISGTLRKFALRVPEVIKECSGIIVFGKKFSHWFLQRISVL